MARLCNSGSRIFKKFGHDGDYNWYFSLTREGAPLVEPYNIFSYTFATMAYGQLAKATGNKEYEQITIATFEKFYQSWTILKINGTKLTKVHEI